MAFKNIATLQRIGFAAVAELADALP